MPKGIVCVVKQTIIHIFVVIFTLHYFQYIDKTNFIYLDLQILYAALF